MKITKYDASGNTFVIFHTSKKDDYSQLSVSLCRQESVDGLIVIVPHNEYDFEWLFYNNDGSTASMCGNGTRAVAHYALDNNLAKKSMRFLTGAGEINCIVDGFIVETTMPKPKIILDYFEELGHKWILIDTGVPHLVTIVDNLDKFDLEVCSTMRYKYNANVNFANVKDASLFVKTYERGVENETQACGTGMTACFLDALNNNLIKSPCEVFPQSNEKLVLKQDENGLYFKGQVNKGISKEVDVF